MSRADRPHQGALGVGLAVQLTLRVLEPVRWVEKAAALAGDAAPASIA